MNSVLILGVAAVLAVSGDRDGPGVTGRVVRDGAPVGGAIVAVGQVVVSSQQSAYVRNHRDAGYWSRADEDGRFVLPLSGTAESVSLTVMSGAGTGSATVRGDQRDVGDIVLQAQTPAEDVKIGHVRVVGPDGEPVPGACVMPSLLVMDRSSGWAGPSGLTVGWSDAAGLASVGYSRSTSAAGWDALAVEVRVVAPGFAPTEVRADFDEVAREVRLTRGCRVIGEIVTDSGPLVGAWIDLASEHSGGDPMFTRAWARTDDAGRFVFEHVPANRKVWLSGGAWGNDANLVVPVLKGETLGDGAVLDVGRLQATKARRVAGKFVRKDGGAIPARTWAAISHEHAYLSWATPLGDGGTFEFAGVPDGGPYLLSVGTYELIISQANIASQPGWYMALRGMVTRDHPDMVVELVERSPENMRMGIETQQPRDKPMRGVEGTGAQ